MLCLRCMLGLPITFLDLPFCIYSIPKTASQDTKATTSTSEKKKFVVVKSSFNIQPPTGELAATGKQDKPTAQDIKDGHAYLRSMPKFLYQVRSR